MGNNNDGTADETRSENNESEFMGRFEPAPNGVRIGNPGRHSAFDSSDGRADRRFNMQLPLSAAERIFLLVFRFRRRETNSPFRAANANTLTALLSPPLSLSKFDCQHLAGARALRSWDLEHHQTDASSHLAHNSPPGRPASRPRALFAAPLHDVKGVHVNDSRQRQQHLPQSH